MTGQGIRIPLKRQRATKWAIAGALTLAFHAQCLHADAQTAYPPRPRPAPAISPFVAVEGLWRCDGVLPAGALAPGAPKMAYSSTLDFHPIQDGFAYAIDYRQSFADNPMVFSGTWYAGWDAPAGALGFFWLDNMGTLGRETSAGWKDNRLELTGKGWIPASPTLGGKHSDASAVAVQTRDSFALTGGTQLHWKGEMWKPGDTGWTVIGDDTCARTTAVPPS